MSDETKSTLQKLKETYQAFEQIVASNTVNKGFKVRWLVQTKNALTELWGKDAPAVRSLLTLVESERKTDGPTPDLVATFQQVGSFIRLLETSCGNSLSRSVSCASAPPATKQIFIIHGHDELNTRRLGDLMRDMFGLTPVVIRGLAGAGQAILQKFESHADPCSFAFGLFTPDDVVRASQSEYRQSRPNVIFETGWFVGRLGSPRVCLLLQDGTDIHSDLHGISRIQFHTNVEEKVADIQRELRSANLI